LQIIHLLYLLHTPLPWSNFQSSKWIQILQIMNSFMNHLNYKCKYSKNICTNLSQSWNKKGKSQFNWKKEKNKWIDGIASVACDVQTKHTYQPNWEFEEIMTLIQSKCDGFTASLDVINPIDQMENFDIGHSLLSRNKWPTRITGEPYIGISYVCLIIWQELRTILNIGTWLLKKGCSKSSTTFNKSMHERIESFMGTRPMLWLPHVCDLMFLHDNNCTPSQHIKKSSIRNWPSQWARLWF